MLFAVTAALFIIAVTVWLWSHRNPYLVLRSDWDGVHKDRLVQLPPPPPGHAKLATEVKIFNRLYLVMPTVHGVAVPYAQHLQALLQNPKHKPGADPYDKLCYGYACAVLASKTKDALVARQLRQNLLFLLAPKRKIVKKIKPVWSRQIYQLYPAPIYKIFNDGYVDPADQAFTVAVPLQTAVLGSYLKYYHRDLTIKRFANYYELWAPQPQQITFNLAADKGDYDCQVARSVVTCKNLVTGRTRVLAIRGDKIRITTSICEKTDALKLYLQFQGAVTVSIDHGQRQLLSATALAFNQRVEQIVTRAYRSKYVQGEKLRVRYQAAAKCVPSLPLLTQVVEITSADAFFAVLDDLPYYQRAAELFGGFNLVCLYSSGNQFVADLVAGFMTGQEVAALRAAQLLLFFVDRTVTAPDALYFLTKMTKPGRYVPVAPSLYPERVSRTYPYTRRVTVANPSAKPVTLKVVIPLIFQTPQVVTVQGQILTAVGLYTGKVTTYKLPVAMHWENEWLTTQLSIPLSVKLMGFEQKVYTIQRHDQPASYRERKKQFMASLENIVINTADKKLNQVLAKPVSDTPEVALLTLVKAAVKNVDKKLLLSVLEDKHTLPFDVWQYLLTQVVGIRLRRGKVHLAPCVNLMGEFTVTFQAGGEKYTFNTKKGLPSDARIATISYG